MGNIYSRLRLIPVVTNVNQELFSFSKQFRLSMASDVCIHVRDVLETFLIINSKL